MNQLIELPNTLQRMSLGDVTQLPTFSGEVEDYHYVADVYFRGESDGRGITLHGVENYGIHWNTEKYYPENRDSFLSIVDNVLNNIGWYLIDCGVVKPSLLFNKNFKLIGRLYK